MYPVSDHQKTTSTPYEARLSCHFCLRNFRLKGRFVVAGVVFFFTTLSSLLISISKTFRRIVSHIPPSWIVAAHALRIIPGVVILTLFEMGLLPATFALGAGYGDIISGVMALPVAWMLAKGLRWRKGSLSSGTR